MKTFFYVIEWHDGSGKTSGLVQASLVDDAFDEVHHMAQEDKGHVGVRGRVVGDIVAFNKVGD